MILRHAKRAHVGLGYIAAVAVIAFAILLGLVSIALPMIAQHPARVQAWLEHRTKRPVSFKGLHTTWTRLGPLIELDDLRIGDGANAVAIGDAELLASVYLGLLPGHAFTELRLRGLDLTLERGSDGIWQVRGLPGQERKNATDPFDALEQLGELHVIDGRLSIIAPAYDINAVVPRVDVRLRVDGPRVRAGVRAWPRVGGRAVDGVLDFDRVRGDGDAYAGADNADLSEWSRILHAGGVRVSGGRGNAQAWAHLHRNRVTRVTARADIGDVALDGAPLDGVVPRLVFDRVDVLGHWSIASGKWNVSLPTLRLQQGASRQVLDGLALAGGGRFDLSAGNVDVAPLLQAVALTDRLPAGARRWIREARPSGRVDTVHLRSRPHGMQVDAQLASLGFDRVGQSPGIRGVAGHLQGDSDGIELEFDRTSDVHFSWPQAFGAEHVVRLTGRAAAWRDGDGWRIGTRALHIGGHDYAADVRGGVLWQGDGSRPFLDLAADVAPAQVPVARRFWVRNVMPPQLVQWLDSALLAGRVEHGRAVIVGDLDDWPFRHGEGRFEARAHVVGATVKFQPDWLPAENVDADVVFLSNGLDVRGTGRMGAVAIPALSANIDDYATGKLLVEARADAEAGRVLDLLRASPLQKSQGETLTALSATGPARVGFRLDMPLHRTAAEPEPLAISGDIDLLGTTLSDRRWDLRFDQVTGHATYDQAGFTAPELSVVHSGQPGRLALRAGAGHVRDAANGFEGGVDASFDVDELLHRAPEMAWLGPYVSGRSNWNVGVVVPRPTTRAAPVAHLQLRSGLAGTALDLPAPLRKPAAQTLAALVDTPLPLGSGDVVVSLGNLVGVRARSSQGRTGVRVQLGSGVVTEAAPVQGLVATGRAAQIDALDWIGFIRGSAGTSTGGAGSGGGLSLQRIDVTTQRLAMLGGQFGESRLQATPSAGGALSVRVDGPSLSGSVAVPAGSGPIVGRFARVYWRGVPGSPGIAGMAPPARAVSAPTMGRRPPVPGRVTAAPAPVRASRIADVAFDPAHIPGLTLDIDDLRLGTAQLGVARLRTHPTAAGMQLDQFSARGRSGRLDATGEWLGRGPSERSRFAASISSDNFGGLLEGLGLGGRLGGGHGTARFDATWPGAPSDFSIAGVQGALALDARNGRLLEVEPGAGRVLGLLSLAELPRRLTLDFRDFFSKGFSFNAMQGNVRFANGFARSDDLAIKGPAADIRIKGAANLRQQTFDQTIEVRPRSGNLLTAVGAIAGGPVGAAIGAAANAVLSRPLGQLGAKTYRVTGPWAEPKVEVMTRDQTRAAAATSPAG